MTRGLSYLLIAAAAVAIGLWAVTRPQTIAEAEVAGLTGDAAAGERVFWAAGCASCHAAEEAEGDARLVLGGGRAFASDFGLFHAPNISPDPTHGIGGWTLAEFMTAMQEGVSPEGEHYYPAFPYPAYRLAERQDLADLFAFLQTLPASTEPSLPHELGFPFSVRRFVGMWKFLYLEDDFAVAGNLPPDATRGRYLAEALAHCGECHTPRTALGGLDRSAWMAGAPNPSQEGLVPALTPEALSWSAAEITNYLTDGFTPSFDVAGGNMADVVHAMARLPQEDRAAIAAYIKALPTAE